MNLRARLLGFWSLMHPGPSLVTVLAFDLCAMIAARGRPDLGHLELASAGLICQQFAISALNDYCDRASDARLLHKRKPIVLGLVSPGLALGSAIILAIAMFILLAPLGWQVVLLASWFLALGVAYDLGVKGTPFSGVMLGLAFPTIPLLAWQIFATLRPELLFAFPLGMVIGVGIQLADALPDAEADAAAGIHGLAQTLGPRAIGVCWSMIGVALAIIFALAIARLMSDGNAASVLLVTGLVGLGLLIAAIDTVRRSSLPASVQLKRHFHFLIGASLVVVAGWFTSIVV